MHSNRSCLQLPTDKRYLILAANACAFDFVSTLLKNNVNQSDIILVLDSLHPLEPPFPFASTFIESRNFNQLLKISVDSNCNVCCVFGWYAILPPIFIRYFDGLIFNMHFGTLPLYRGAGGFSWQILHEHKSLCAHIHQLIHKTDAGPIILSTCASLKLDFPKPTHFHKLATSLAQSVAESFARILVTQQYLSFEHQDESKAIYFPRLNTFKDGCIDFRWTYHHVERFIRAFSYPYPGAWFRYQDKQFHCHTCSLITNFEFHPFASGLIVNTLDKGICVSFSDSVVLISDIYDANTERADISSFRIGLRLQTFVSSFSV